MSGTIYYIDYMQDGNKKGNVGFVKIHDRGLQCSLHSVPPQCGKQLSIYGIHKNGEKIALTEITLYKGKGQTQCLWNQQLSRQECCAIFIPLYDGFYGRCILQPYHKKQGQAEGAISNSIKKTDEREYEKKAEEKVEKQIRESEEIERIIPSSIEAEQKKRTSFIEELIPLEQDKWEQMYKMYPQVHLFPHAQSIVIKPKDLLVLTHEYQDLASNSFILHAYYNYRQLLLIKNLTKKEYYIGVPGSYLEREKRVALLFGFEGFENGESYLQEKEERKAYPGCFGYYLKKVEI